MNGQCGQTQNRKIQGAGAPSSILVVDDEENSRNRLKIILREVESSDRVDCHFAATLDEALDVLSKTAVDVVLLDKGLRKRALGEIDLSPQNNGIEAIPALLAVQPHIQIIVVSGSNDHQDAVRALSLGALDYVTKQTPDAVLLSHISRAIGISKISRSKVRFERAIPVGSLALGGSSPVFQAILKRTKAYAQSDSPVLLLGETGTGKTAIAKWIHECRMKALNQTDRPFYHINLGGLAETIIESELFGHERGSFTDAVATKEGVFELASHGTLFLDELGNASPKLQAKLLTVVESGEYFRMGGKKKLVTHAKLIFATNRNLEKMIDEGTFMEDLFMRISMFPVRMPSLSERKEDIPEIIRALLPKANKANRTSIKYEEIPNDFIEYLVSNPGRGNIRGIENKLGQFLLSTKVEGDEKPDLANWRGIEGLYDNKLDAAVSRQQAKRAAITLSELRDLPFDVMNEDFPGLKALLGTVTKKVLLNVYMKESRQAKAAALLGISPSHLSLLYKEHGIENRRAPRSKGGLQSQPHEEEVL